jgi:hypothetical protein
MKRSDEEITDVVTDEESQMKRSQMKRSQIKIR